MTPLERIRQLYYEATRETIGEAFDEAIDLLKSMSSEEERARAAVFMDGLAQMRGEWRGAPPKRPRRPRSR